MKNHSINKAIINYIIVFILIALIFIILPYVIKRYHKINLSRDMENLSSSIVAYHALLDSLQSYSAYRTIQYAEVNSTGDIMTFLSKKNNNKEGRLVGKCTRVGAKIQDIELSLFNCDSIPMDTIVFKKDICEFVNTVSSIEINSDSYFVEYQRKNAISDCYLILFYGNELYYLSNTTNMKIDSLREIRPDAQFSEGFATKLSDTWYLLLMKDDLWHKARRIPASVKNNKAQNNL